MGRQAPGIRTEVSFIASNRDIDCTDIQDTPCVSASAVGVELIQRRIELTGPLNEDQRSRLMSVADRCPVQQTFDRRIKVELPLLFLDEPFDAQSLDRQTSRTRRAEEYEFVSLFRLFADLH